MRLGFPGDQATAHLFWVTFWSSAAPTIVTAAIIAVAAGVYLSDRDRRREREAEQRAARVEAAHEVGVLRRQLDQALRNDDSWTVWPLGSPPSARAALSPQARAVWAVVEDQRWRRWRAHVVDTADVDLLAAVEAFNYARRDYDEGAAIFDTDLTQALAELDTLHPGRWSAIHQDKERAYLVARGRGDAHDPTIAALELSGASEDELQKEWDELEREDVLISTSAHILGARRAAVDATLDALARRASIIGATHVWF